MFLFRLNRRGITTRPSFVQREIRFHGTGDQRMIKLTRLDGEAFILNADLIRYVERRPDTFITLTTGERIVVRESMDDVVDRSVRYQQQKHYCPLPKPVSATPSL